MRYTEEGVTGVRGRGGWCGMTYTEEGGDGGELMGGVG